jgi:hypothetical protein
MEGWKIGMMEIWNIGILGNKQTKWNNEDWIIGKMELRITVRGTAI